MGTLNEHFRQSGYTLHRAALRKERLPRCCRENLRPHSIGIQYLDEHGEAVVLPLVSCTVCGSQFARSNERYLKIGNMRQFEVVPYPSKS